MRTAPVDSEVLRRSSELIGSDREKLINWFDDLARYGDELEASKVKMRNRPFDTAERDHGIATLRRVDFPKLGRN